MSRVGKRVLYRLDYSDVTAIMNMRNNGVPVNPPIEGIEYPGVIVADWGFNDTGCVNLSVLLDGDTRPFWKTSVQEGTNAGEWQFID